MKIEKLLLIPFVSIVFFLSGCGQVIGNSIDTTAGDISSGKLRKEVFALVSSAENSSTDYAEQYAYIEDIGDGRGYTAGIIGFTTGTGDLLEVVERYTELEPENELKKYIPYLQQAAKKIAYVDVVCSFAESAILYNWNRPHVLSDSLEFSVKNGRHPVVERHLPAGEFVPNDVSLCGSEPENSASFALITGPNMAGKSTFLRQNALIALLAQTGSFVPADEANIGIVDRIFCRVGASDNLARGESTFLVEMTETARILRSATQNSLVIMDEVGRGTSTEDGLSIAWAVSEYLLNTLKCKTFFATHYHELTRLEHKSLKRLCMAVAENGSDIVFLRKVVEGSSENSYGIHVARLAGIPESVIERAGKILEKIQGDASVIIPETETEEVSKNKVEIFSGSLFSEEELVLDEILSCDIDNMTPMVALQNILRWKKSLAEK